MGSASKLVFTIVLLLLHNNRIAAHTPPDDFDRAFEKCRAATTCTECLATYTEYSSKYGYNCGYTDGECWLGGVEPCTWQAKMPREYGEAQGNGGDVAEAALAAAQQQCSEYQVIEANEAVCKKNYNCQDCQETELAVGEGFCLWYDAPYGESFCASASKNPADTPVIGCNINESNEAAYDDFLLIQREKCSNSTTSCTDCVTTLTSFGYDCAYQNGGCGFGGSAGGYQASIPRCLGKEDGDLETVAQESCDAYEARKANEAACTPIGDCHQCLATELPANAGNDNWKFCLWFPSHGGHCASRSWHESEVPVQNCSGETSAPSIAPPRIARAKILLFFGGLFLLPVFL